MRLGRKAGACLIACGLIAAAACNSSSTFTIDPASSQAPEQQGNSADSVQDLIGGSGGNLEPWAPFDAIRARVRNESSSAADITMRFLNDAELVHLAFVRVAPQTITTVTSPQMAERVELSGLNGKGELLAGKIFTLGIDFAEGIPAEYLIRDAVSDSPPSSPLPDTGDAPDTPGGGVDPPGGGDGPDGEVADEGNGGATDNPGGGIPPIGDSGSPPVARPSLRLLEPAEDIEVEVGGVLRVRWDDMVVAADATLSFAFRQGETEVPMAANIWAVLDGLADETELLIPKMSPGLYELIGRLHDRSVVSASAPGRVRVVAGESNVAPSIEFLQSGTGHVVRNGDRLHVAWSDEDPDDNATIEFSLESAELSDGGAVSVTLSPTFAEDPDGAADEADLLIEGVIPGHYHLVATISDGELSGRDQLEGIVRVLPDRQNAPPGLSITHPDVDIDVNRGESFSIRWIDEDENDNAQIIFMLDPDFANVPLDGDEYLLAAPIAEDPDGDGDEASVMLPVGVPNGAYRVVGVIRDGLVEVMTAAPGVVYVGRESDEDTGNEEDPPVEGEVGATPIGTITTLEPWTYVVEDVGEPLTIRFVSQGQAPARQRIYVSNVPYGGSTRVEVVPSGAAVNFSKDFSVAVDLRRVPNRAWPRTFDIETEVHYTDGSQVTYRSLRPIRIMQQVEIVSAEMVNYTCPGGPGAESFSGLEVTWYGGGFTEQDNDAEVQLWLVKDGIVPISAESDSTHRLLISTHSSPNVEQTQWFSIGSILGLIGATASAQGGVSSIAEPGEYELFAVYEPFGVNRLISDPFADSFRLCAPSSVEGSVLSP